MAFARSVECLTALGSNCLAALRAGTGPLASSTTRSEASNSRCVRLRIFVPELRR